jgi:hypothetical protein
LVVSLTTTSAWAGPISQWNFDETEGTLAADRVGSRDGTLVGDAAFVPDGVSGNAVQMSRDGSGYIDFGNVLPLHNGDFSISIWIRMTEGDSSEQLILGRAGENTGGYFIRVNSYLESYGAAGKAWFFAGTGTQGPGPQPVSITSINDGQWHHIVVTYDASGETRLYVDGAFESSTASVDIPFADRPFQVGGYVSDFLGVTADYDGLVDELAIYNDLLSDSEVLALFEDTPGSTMTLNINPGLNDAWFDPATDGQGFFINVFDETGVIFLSWFTFDTERPPGSVDAVVGEPGHRWLTALGEFNGATATLDVTNTTGGLFDRGEPRPVNDNDYGTITLSFEDCATGLVEYDLPGPGVSGSIPIQRVVQDNVALCEALSGNKTSTTR